MVLPPPVTFRGLLIGVAVVNFFVCFLVEVSRSEHQELTQGSDIHVSRPGGVGSEICSVVDMIL